MKYKKFNTKQNTELFPTLRPIWNDYFPIIITFLLLIVVLLILKNTNLDLGDWIQIGIGFAIFWYSLETMLVRKSMVFQNELEQRPIVDLYLRPEDKKYKGVKERRWFALRNIGKGAAYNVRVENIDLNTFLYKFFFENANKILAPLGDEKPLDMVTLTKKGEKGLEKYGMIMHETEEFLNELKHPNSVPFLVKYSNIQGKPFFSLFKIYNQIPSATQPIIEFIRYGSGSISLEQAKTDSDTVPVKLTPYHNEG